MMKHSHVIALLFVVVSSLASFAATNTPPKVFVNTTRSLLSLPLSQAPMSADLPLYTDLDLPSSRAKTPNFQDILSTLRFSSQAGHETIAEVLADLKIRFPDFFDYYVLNYHSSSLQGSSRAQPRVILHGNGNLFLAFNGDAQARGYSDIEMIEFKEASGYEFHSLHFPKDGSGSRVDKSEISERIGSIEVSKPNPAGFSELRDSPRDESSAYLGSVHGMA